MFKRAEYMITSGISVYRKVSMNKYCVRGQPKAIKN